MDSYPSTFARLIDQARKGDEAAAAQLIREYQPSILRTIRRHMAAEIRRKFDSQDFVQAVWASFFRHRETVLNAKEPAQLASFLAAVAKNKLYDELRKRNTQKYDVNREQPLQDSNPSQGRKTTPSHYVMARESLEQMADGLTDRDRQILEMRIQGRTHSEIAGNLDVSIRTVARVLERLERNRESTTKRT